MSSSPPTKPPRGIKNAKETSGLLMSVIRTLSASETNEQREREKAKLETEYKRSDRKLDELIAKHDQDLTQVMQIFTTLSSQVTASREKIHAVKENLHACKTLLHCRREELQKLWLEGIEYKYMLQLLEEIERMNEVPGQLSAFLSKKHYLHATKLLVSAVSLGKGALEGVEDLNELSMELENKRQQLHTNILEDLTRHLYAGLGQDALQLRRQGSGRETAFLGSPFQRDTELRSSQRQKARRALLDATTPQKKNDTVDDEIVESTVGDPESNSNHFMAIIVECLALLEKVPDAVETIKVQMQTELLSIIHRTTLQVLDHSSIKDQINGKQNLLELLDVVFEQMRAISKAHSTVLQHLTRVVEKYKIDVKLYDMQDYWSKVQGVLQLLLTDYLDIQNISIEPMQPATFTESADISTFFSRRKVQSKKKGSLFKFEGSTNILTMNNYLKHGGNEMNRIRDKILVCPPDPNNITFIFLPLMKFIEEIEQQLKSSNKIRTPCTLHQFISDYVSEVFLLRKKSEVASNVEAAVRTPDAWKAITTPDQMRELGLLKPLLSNTVTVEKCLHEWRNLMSALPPHAERLAQIVISILQAYRDTCIAAYRGIAQPHPEDRRVCSAAWLKDEDISRFLMSLPNWLNLKAQREMQSNLLKSGRLMTGRKDMVCEEEESPADVRQRNLHEAEILASNLGEGGISAQEIIADMNMLKCLAQLQESMEWFSDSMRRFAQNIKSEPTASSCDVSITLDTPLPLSEPTLKQLTTLADNFDELANTCLLVLHLEVRVQCFHYLLSKSDMLGNMESQEPDPKVQELSRTLIAFDEAMTASLQPRKCKYIFEGLGYLIAKIIISSSQYMDKIDEAGIQRMCRNVFSLQQTLTNITMCREVALDHARHYFELFYLSPEEILTGVMEKGPEFSELEYMNAFQLLHRSQINKDHGAVRIHLERLSDILGEVGVTV